MKTYLKPLGFILAIVLLLSSFPILGVSAETYYVENGFKCRKTSENEVVVCGYTGSDTEVVIPSKLIGCSVIGVDNYAFLNNATITSITLPNTMKSLGMGAFRGCTKLESINLPVNCTQLGDYLFYGCTALENVRFDTVTDYIPRFCFSRCGNLKSLTLPETVKTIGEYAFSYCKYLENVYIPRYAQEIDDTAFYETPDPVISSYPDTVPHDFSKEHYIAFRNLETGITTYYVTYLNYDGSVFFITPAQEGKIAPMPSKSPIKPSTDTHTYSFMYWDGKITNISSNTKIYPVFNETPIPSSYTAIFLNGDLSALKSESVPAGGSATPPDTTPTKEAGAGKYYTFIGWDKSLDNIREDTVFTPLFSENTFIYTVTFLDAKGNVFATYQVPYGEASPIPESSPNCTSDEAVYEFERWDTDTSSVTSDLIVNPVFKEVKPPVIPMGTLNIIVTGGTGFRISVNGSASRPQGTGYTNSKIPMGASVTVTANSSSQSEFLGWMNDRGLILTSDLSYTFTATGNDYLKAMYQTDIEEATLVIFKNDKANQILDMQYYMMGDEISFPEFPVNPSYEATGWSMSGEEIKAKVTSGESVTVVPTWERILVYVNIEVVGGTATGLTDGKVLKLSAVTATAAKAPEGEKFAYWADQDGKVLSYQSTYKFYPAEDMTVTAVYVAESETIDYEIILNFVMDTTAESTDTNPMIISWEVTESANVKFVQAGALIVESTKYNADTFCKGTADTNVTKWTPGSSNQKPVNTVTANKKGVENGSTWIIQGWLTYEANGQQYTLYTELSEVTKAEK